DGTRSKTLPDNHNAKIQDSNRTHLRAGRRPPWKNSPNPGSTPATNSDRPKRCAVSARRAASSAGLAAARDTRTASPFAPRGPVFQRLLKPIESSRNFEKEFYRIRVVKQC